MDWGYGNLTYNLTNLLINLTNLPTYLHSINVTIFLWCLQIGQVINICKKSYPSVDYVYWCGPLIPKCVAGHQQPGVTELPAAAEKNSRNLWTAAMELLLRRATAAALGARSVNPQLSLVELEIEVLQSQKRSLLLGPSPGWKRLLALSHLTHY